MTLDRSTPLRRTPFKRKPLGQRSPVLTSTTPRRRKCAVCAEPFKPQRMGQKVCGMDCAQVQGRRETEKQERAETKRKLDEMRPRKWFLAKAKKALHAYIRARDEGRPCISCDTILRNTGKPGGDYDAGHFRSVGSAKHLEFDERNIFGQCKHCNDYLKGNQLEYERRLRILAGDDYVDSLLADNEPRHHTIDDFLMIETIYKAKLRALKETV
jgi:hypothetical protein